MRPRTACPARRASRREGRQGEGGKEGREGEGKEVKASPSPPRVSPPPLLRMRVQQVPASRARSMTRLILPARLPHSPRRERRDHRPRLCMAESDDLATPEVHTAAGHTGFRLRRSGGYSPAELDGFATRFAALAEQRDVYVYFKHEDDPSGALNAAAFLKRIRAEAGTP